MPSGDDVVTLSRLQFGLTALYHFLFVPLTLGMTFILAIIANGWMQYPVGAEFNHETLRMEMASFADVFFNPVAQVKFVHTVAAGYVIGSMFVLGISSWYLLNHRDIPSFCFTPVGCIKSCGAA